MQKPMEKEKEEAKAQFRRFVSLYGLQWTARVPAHAWDILDRINQILTAADRREAILRRR
jgi:hypothetical protein